MARVPLVETLAIGDELLTGKISDTNSTFVANVLFQRGIRLNHISVIPDTIPALHEAMQLISTRADVVICFGGLGPTSDDKTAEGVAALIGGTVIEHESSKARLLEMYRSRNREVMPSALKQIFYPEKAEPLPNSRGSAPGFHCQLGNARFYFLPGVPAEMKAMFHEGVLAHLEETWGKAVEAGNLLSHQWKCLGIWESQLQTVMDPIEAQLPAGAWLGYRTHFPENHLSLYYPAQSPDDAARFSDVKQKIGAVLAPWTYTEERKELEELVLEALKERGWKVALAESCTGGLVVQRLTTIPGASASVWGGFTCYQVGAKQAMLGVEVESPEAAVSQDCSRRLADAAKRKSGCDVAAAITGYVGPDGGTASDPVGTLYLCVVGSGAGEEPQEQRVVLTVRERKQTQWGAATYLLQALLSYLRTHK